MTKNEALQKAVEVFGRGAAVEESVTGECKVGMILDFGNMGLIGHMTMFDVKGVGQTWEAAFENVETRRANAEAFKIAQSAERDLRKRLGIPPLARERWWRIQKRGRTFYNVGYTVEPVLHGGRRRYRAFVTGRRRGGKLETFKERFCARRRVAKAAAAAWWRQMAGRRTA